jgi:hypothetical protein
MDAIQAQLAEFNGPFAKLEFAHFYTSNDCDNFIRYAVQQKIAFSHRCCGGKGCGFKNINNPDLHKILDVYAKESK